MTKETYARQKTWQAVSVMVGDRPIRERLSDAGMALLVLRNPKQDLPPEFLPKLEQIIDSLTREGTTNFETGTSSLSDEEARIAATGIVELFLDVFGGL